MSSHSELSSGYIYHCSPEANNGRSNINWTSRSGLKFSTTKSTRKIIDPTFTSTSSTTPSGLATDLSSNCKTMVVGLGLPNPSFLYSEVGIQVMVSPKSHNHQAWILWPIKICTVKLPKFFILMGKLFWILEFQSTVRLSHIRKMFFYLPQSP